MALERVADGVWLLRGDFRGAMNIYFIEDGDGVVQFDAGTKSMHKKAAVEARQLGGLKRGVSGPPPPAFAGNHKEPKRSLRRLAELDPLVVGTGHEVPLRGDNLRATLEAAA